MKLVMSSDNNLRVQKGDIKISVDDIKGWQENEERHWDEIQSEKFNEQVGVEARSSGRSTADMDTKYNRPQNTPEEYKGKLQQRGEDYLKSSYGDEYDAKSAEEVANSVWWKGKNPVEFRNTNPKMNEYLNNQIDAIPGLRNILSKKGNNIKRLNKKELKTAGILRVPGFTKRDGTKVKPYFRILT